MNATIYSLHRKGRLQEVELNDAIPSSLPFPRVNCQRTELWERLNAALGNLSPAHYTVFVLKELEGLQYNEIAELLNFSIGRVMSRLFYARKNLQSLLGPFYNEI
jgi:RNA polymerase sigma-70 factor (ECF subfamily)